MRGRNDHFGMLRHALIGALAILALPSGPAAADAPIRIVMPAPAGGAGDLLVRMLVEQVARAHDRTFVVENRVGAAGAIGTEAVMRAQPDGTSLLFAGPPLLISSHLHKLSSPPLASLAPICQLVSSPGVIAVNDASPYRTLSGVIDAARAKPGALTFAAAGPRTLHHLGFEMLKRASDADMTFVPYPGGAPAISALLGGHVTMVLAEYAPLAEHLKAAKLRALATTARARIAALPEIPTVSELFKSYELDFWWGLLAPARTPKETLAQFGDWFSRALKSVQNEERFARHGFIPAPVCGAEFAVLLREQHDSYGRVIREANIKAD